MDIADMHLNQQTDYALRVLIYTAAHAPNIVNIRSIAEDYQISKSHLMKVVSTLVRVGLLRSIRGKNGGLLLGRQPEQIPIGAVVRFMEPLRLVECMGEGNRCRISRDCLLGGILAGAAQSFLEYLDEYTLADLLNPPTVGLLLHELSSEVVYHEIGSACH